MCYSAQIHASYRKYVREFGASVSFEHFVELYWEKRRDGGWSKLPIAAFLSAVNDKERAVADLVAAGDKDQTIALETELFQQKTRLTAAERALAAKPTKKAENDQRTATDKIARAQRNLADLQRADLLDPCIVPVKPEHVEAWLNPDAKNLAALDAILDDRNQPYYEHQLAA